MCYDWFLIGGFTLETILITLFCSAYYWAIGVSVYNLAKSAHKFEGNAGLFLIFALLWPVATPVFAILLKD